MTLTYFLTHLIAYNHLNNYNLKTKKMIMNTIKYNEPRKDVKLLPWQVTGLTDGEGGFNCYIAKTETEKLISNSFNTNIKLEFKLLLIFFPKIKLIVLFL